MTAMTDQEYRDHLRSVADRAGIEVDEIVLPERRHMRLGALQFRVLDWGGTGQPLVMLHGGGLTAHTWDICCLALHGRYRCIAPDLRGHGDSEWPQGAAYALSSQSGDVAALCEALGLDKVAIVGMSLGSLVASTFAVDHPERVEGLVLVDASPEVRPESVQKARRFIADAPSFATLDDAIDYALTFNPRRSRDLLRKSLLRNLRRTDDGHWTWKHDPRRYDYYQTEAFRQECRALWERLDQVSCPVLVVRGADSKIFHAPDAERLMARFANASEVVIADAGHTIQGDNPKALVATLRSFLGEVLAPSPG